MKLYLQQIIKTKKVVGFPLSYRPSSKCPHTSQFITTDTSSGNHLQFAIVVGKDSASCAYCKTERNVCLLPHHSIDRETAQERFHLNGPWTSGILDPDLVSESILMQLQLLNAGTQLCLLPMIWQ